MTNDTHVSTPATVGRALAVGVAYFAAAALGLSLASEVSASITFIWFPSGIALAAVLLWGSPMLPAVFVGAFAINSLMGDASPPAAAMIAVGNTCEALVAAHLFIMLRGRSPHPWQRLRLVRAPRPFTERIDLARLVFAVAVACSIPAIVGTEALLVTEALSPADWPTAWLLWWLGDFIGIFLVVPTSLLFLVPDAERTAG